MVPYLIHEDRLEQHPHEGDQREVMHDDGHRQASVRSVRLIDAHQKHNQQHEQAAAQLDQNLGCYLLAKTPGEWVLRITYSVI